MKNEFKALLAGAALFAALTALPDPAGAGSQIEITRIEIQDSTVFLHADNVPNNPDNPGKHPWNLEFSCGDVSRHARAVLNLGAIPRRRFRVSALLDSFEKYESRALGGDLEHNHAQHHINPMSVIVEGDLAKESIKATLERTALITKRNTGESNINIVLPESLDLAPALEVLGCIHDLHPGTHLEITQVRIGKNSTFLGTDPLPDGHRMGIQFTCQTDVGPLAATFYLGPWPTERRSDPRLLVFQEWGIRPQVRYPEFEQTWNPELQKWEDPPEYLIVTVPDPIPMAKAVLKHTSFISNGSSRGIVIPESIDIDAIYDRTPCLERPWKP